MTIDWSYHRPGCDSCKRTQVYLAAAGLVPAAQTNAKKEPFDRPAALARAREVDQIIATKGRKVVQLDLRANPSDDELAALILGPHGNLRAPILRLGSTWIIGYDEPTYRELLGA